MNKTLKVRTPETAPESHEPPEAAARVGTLFESKYRLLRLLGEGGAGAVYEAENTWTARRVAVKVLQPGQVVSADAVERFVKEARVTSRIAHPNVVEVFDAGRCAADGTLYIVEEMLEGGDLRRVLRERGRLPPSEAVALALPVADALAAAHAVGVVHRDVKPENIVVAREGDRVVPKLIDFGVAKVREPGSGRMQHTRSGVLLGTPRYMSPEQARGLRDVDGQADVWALGVVLFELLSGRTPFEGPNHNATLGAIQGSDLPPLRSLAPEVPLELATLVERSLVRDRAQRLTMAELRAGLAALAGRSTVASASRRRRLVMAALVGMIALAAIVWRLAR